MISLLIADDNTDFTYNLSEMLTNEEDIVVVGICNNGLDALTRYNEKNPDVLILDLKMPGLTGLDVLRILNNKKRNTPNIIVISGSRDYRAAITYASNISYIFSKPVDFKVLLNKIREIKESSLTDEKLNKNIYNLLFTFKFNMYSKGTQLLIDSIKIAYREPLYALKTEKLMKEVASKNKTNYRTTRSVIDKSINSMYSNQKDLKLLYTIFPDYYGEKPTIKSFVNSAITYLSHID